MESSPRSRTGEICEDISIVALRQSSPARRTGLPLNRKEVQTAWCFVGVSLILILTVTTWFDLGISAPLFLTNVAHEQGH